MTKDECLKKIARDFLIAQAGLEYEERIITNRNFAGSLFLSNSDVTNLRAKKAVIDSLIQTFAKEIFSLSKKKEQEKYLPIGTAEEKIRRLESHISTLSDGECGNVLTKLLNEINPILDVEANSENRRDHAEYMDDSGKRSALKVHSFNDGWFFTFLSKLVQKIQETIGMKTSEEKLLEHSVQEAESSLSL
ncbi:hypothetical protein Lgra_2017 [Legionella gratiana]|uniref:Uncharacterized protein n=1 Tax=Legionella gratiana TaxID=45066 RepID=A0A378JAH2_9GAMM|nr:hypothetical protein [Legionella gratiana]KTD11051.1 hypothetical protein Lgra_2017 [Legionella gratiana]STX44605.1 Uncharacterised protein [Legionella gratiana]